MDERVKEIFIEEERVLWHYKLANWIFIITMLSIFFVSLYIYRGLF